MPLNVEQFTNITGKEKAREKRKINQRPKKTKKNPGINIIIIISSSSSSRNYETFGSSSSSIFET